MTAEKMKRNFILIFKILVILSIGPIIIYVIRFYSNPLSDNPTEWGPFGDFVGGVLNPFLTLGNIFILGYLTYQIAQKDENAEIKNLNLQRQLILSQLRQDAFKEYVQILDTVIHTYDDSWNQLNGSVGEKATVATEKLLAINENQNHLFPIFNSDEIFKTVVETLQNISVINQQMMDPQVQKDPKALGVFIANLIEEKKEIKQRMQAFLLDELNK